MENKVKRTYPQLVATILENEIKPRCNKLKVGLSEVNPQLTAGLISLEFAKATSRKDTRNYLDFVFYLILENKTELTKVQEDFLKKVEKFNGIKLQ